MKIKIKVKFGRRFFSVGAGMRGAILRLDVVVRLGRFTSGV